MRILLLSLLSALFLSANAQTVEADFNNVVPLPDVVTQVNGAQPVNLNKLECICYGVNDERMIRNARFLSAYIKELTGEELPVQIDCSRNIPAILLGINKKMIAPEGYVIEVGKKSIRIEGATPQGVFYGIQAFRKALPQVSSDQVVIPPVRVSATPRFGYRGLHFDVSRHFFSVDFVKQYIDMMALHQMNTFHWHITDDQGWRFPVAKYPRLIEVGAWRDETVIGRNSGLYDHQRYGGYYTSEQIRDIVRYAQERYITIIPEVDMPGHMEAALAAYPELGCTGGPYEVEKNWGVFDDVLCPGKEQTFRFICDVLDEVMALFPSEYIHIGGDESPRTRWKVCPDCQRRISDEGLQGDGKRSAEDLLQGYFTRRVEKYVQSRGRKIIGWDELIDCNVDASATIMNWRSWQAKEDVIRAAERGHDIIKVPTDPLYFDYYQTHDSVWNRPFLIGGFCPLENVYAYEPAPADLSAQAKSHIIGVQANLWTEYIVTEELAEYQLLPRIAALCELQWLQPEKKNYQSFLRRLRRLTDLYRHYGWTYCDAGLK